ncbi:MAG: biotin/lipoyl-binding protein [Bacteroidia bacterium]|nr:biotin/lipoyl-binding protein [Bacteroidia bacterium]
MYQASVNQKNPVDIKFNEDQVFFGDEASSFDMIVSEPGRHFHLLLDNKSFDIWLIKHDPETKTFWLKINGKLHEVGIKDRYDQLLHSMGLDKMLTNKVNDIKAPMPGLVLSIKVKPGDTIKKGDPLLILEAMKMENIIKSPGEGVVKSIAVGEKQAVDKNQVLIELM